MKCFSVVKTSVAGALLALASLSASAETYTYSFSTFFDTSTATLGDTATLSYSVATMQVTDVAGGVQISLAQLVNSFASFTKNGTTVDQIWLNGESGTVSGSLVSARSGYSYTPIVLDAGNTYNWSVKLSGSGLSEGQTTTFTLSGSSLTAASLVSSGYAPMLDLLGVGGIYGSNANSKVHFLGTLVSTPTVPEPDTVVLALVGGLVVALAARRRQKRLTAR